MAITSVGYGGTVDYPDYGKGVVLPGRYSFDDSTHFRPTRRTGGADRTVRIAGGTAQGYGIRDTESADYVDYQLPSVSSGARWFLIYLKRDWSANAGAGLTTLTHEAANTGSTPLPPSIPGGWYDEPGVLARQPICYARVQAGQQYVTEVRDLRVWANDGGLTATDEGVMQFYDQPGTRIQIGSKAWVWSLAANGASSLDAYDLRPYVPPAVPDTGWRDLDRGRTGYLSSGKYRVRDGWAFLNVDLECASDRPPGTVEIAPGSSAYSHSGNPDMRDVLYCTTDGRAYPARIFQSGAVNAYALPRMNEGDRIYGSLTWPVG